MNKNDKNSLKAFKSMFGALSQSVKRKYERRAAASEIKGVVRDATPEENAIPPIIGPWSLLTPDGAGNVVSLDSVRRSPTRT